MAIELGHFALILGFAIATASAITGLWGWNRSDRIGLVMRQAAVLQFLLVAAAFAALIQAFATSDFSLAIAWQHSHSAQPLLFKITSVWGNHEGSMVLWVLILVGMGAAVAMFSGNLPRDLQALVLAVQSLLTAAFTGFSLFTSNPFARLSPAPFEGQELNPILQDFGLAVHPPLLYAGYVGFSVCFSFAIAALISGRIDAAWARWVRPWTLVSWIFLTLAYFFFGIGYLAYATFAGVRLTAIGASAFTAGTTWVTLGVASMIGSFGTFVLLNDERVKRLALVAALSFGTIGSLVASGNSAASALTGALLVGLGLAATPTIVIAYVRDRASDADYPRAFSIASALLAIGQMIGPLGGGAVGDSVGNAAIPLFAAAAYALAAAAAVADASVMRRASRN